MNVSSLALAADAASELDEAAPRESSAAAVGGASEALAEQQTPIVGVALTLGSAATNLTYHQVEKGRRLFKVGVETVRRLAGMDKEAGKHKEAAGAGPEPALGASGIMKSISSLEVRAHEHICIFKEIERCLPVDWWELSRRNAGGPSQADSNRQRGRRLGLARCVGLGHDECGAPTRRRAGASLGDAAGDRQKGGSRHRLHAGVTQRSVRLFRPEQFASRYPTDSCPRPHASPQACVGR